MNKIKFLSYLIMIVLFAFPAFSAGTYYTGGKYQSPQQRYTASGQTPSAYAPTNNYNQQYTGGYEQQRPATTQVPYTPVNNTGATRTQSVQKKTGANKATGFYLGGGLSREAAQWEFSMNQAGSILSYTDLSWNVLDVNAGYAFGESAFGLKIDAGLKYGTQAGESRMIDDDITNGGYLIATYYTTGGEKIGDVIGHALSVGKSSGGDMLGFNFGLSLADKIAFGKLKVTPSFGYRTLSYTLTTEDNHGMSIDTGYCIKVPGSDETQCDPFIVVYNAGPTPEIIWDNKDTSGGTIDSGGTYYYAQPGVSHKYDVSWSGPYLAVDFDYGINENNYVSLRAELGLPAYTATGDQPYRPDWKHPKSVEDTAGFGDAYHLGLAALWGTALTDNVSLQLGFTYDYYTVTGANAKTYLTGNAYGINGYANGTPYDTIYADIVADYGSESAALDPQTGSPVAIGIKELKDSCPGWVCSADNEVDSFYKSMGIRIGLAAKF